MSAEPDPLDRSTTREEYARQRKYDRTIRPLAAAGAARLAAQDPPHPIPAWATPKGHADGCPMGKALGHHAQECEHGYNVCPTCDPCTCGAWPPTPRSARE